MQLHQLKPKKKNKKRKRIGRGGKKGTYSGRGMKGQRSRAGTRFEPVVRSLIKKYPKLRGYKFKSLDSKSVLINIETLEKNFKNGEKISPQILLEKGLVRKIKGRLPKVKILGKGKTAKSFMIEGCQISKTAEEKIEKSKVKSNEVVK